jgi:ribonuclease BN (tRNA processing enzyme)
MLEVVPIGVNDAFTIKGAQTNYLVTVDGHGLLVDCGTTAHGALQAIGKSFDDIDSVYISHLHLDHTGGLIELALARLFGGLPRPKLYLSERIAAPLWDGFLRLMIENVVDNTGKPRIMTFADYFEAVIIPDTIESSVHPAILAGVLPARLVPVHHVTGMCCHGLLLNDRVFLTTDTVYDPELLRALNQRQALDGIFHDCAFKDSKRAVHATFNQLRELPAELRQRIVLTHYEDEIPEFAVNSDLILGEAGKSYPFS